MAGRESYFWHKLHSLTGIIPVGFYMVQHLTLNSFALVGEDAYNGVIHFFEGLPSHLLLFLKYGLVWAPLIFHAVYGFMITSRALPFDSPAASKYRENKYYIWQRISGIVAMLFLIYHMISTSVAASLRGAESTILYDNWASKLSSFGYLILAIYIIGITASSYHLAYGIWNFCIRWGITISESSQRRMANFSRGAFVALCLLGYAALVGFFYSPFGKKDTAVQQSAVETTAPETQTIRY